MIFDNVKRVEQSDFSDLNINLKEMIFIPLSFFYSKFCSISCSLICNLSLILQTWKMLRETQQIILEKEIMKGQSVAATEQVFTN